MWYLWHALKHWQPFRIDALGIVTLLGADEVNAAIGRLVPTRFFEYMPLLGAFVIAGDRITDKRPGFHLFNISNGFHTAETSSWFSRWVQAQDFQRARSLVYWEISEEPRHRRVDNLISLALGFIFNGPLLALTVLSEDWYGFANAIAMILSIVVRKYVVNAHRRAIDKAVGDAAPNEIQQQDTASSSTIGSHTDPKTSLEDAVKPIFRDAKVMLITPDEKAVTMCIPQRLIVPVFVTNTAPELDWLYHLVRWLGWVAFGIHIITIGMAALPTQMYTIALLVIPTVLTCWKVGCDDSTWFTTLCEALPFRKARKSTKKDDDPEKQLTVSKPYECWIGTRLKAIVLRWPDEVEFVNEVGNGWRVWKKGDDNHSALHQRRQDLYARLNLSEEEEDSLAKWDLLPHKRLHDTSWEEDFNEKKHVISEFWGKHPAYGNDLKIVAQGRLLGKKKGGIRGAFNEPDPLAPRGSARQETNLSASGRQDRGLPSGGEGAQNAAQ